MNNKDLSAIQILELDVMREILRILEREEISYFMQGGTMLGAIRHQGFIPWDDDIDIGILRPDYERFCKLCETELPEHLKLRTYQNDADHHYYFSRVVDTRYHIRRKGGIRERQEELWIDIFPLDGMPKNKIVSLIHKAHLVFCRFLYSVSEFRHINIQRPGRPVLHRCLIYLIRLTRADRLFGRMDRKKILDRIDSLLKKYSVDDTNEIINFMGDNHIRGYSPSCYGLGEEYKYIFEDLELTGLRDFDYYLRALYGNYMQFPREDRRDIHLGELVERPVFGDEGQEEEECGCTIYLNFREEVKEKSLTTVS